MANFVLHYNRLITFFFIIKFNFENRLFQCYILYKRAFFFNISTPKKRTYACIIDFAPFFFFFPFVGPVKIRTTLFEWNTVEKRSAHNVRRHGRIIFDSRANRKPECLKLCVENKKIITKRNASDRMVLFRRCSVILFRGGLNKEKKILREQ